METREAFLIQKGREEAREEARREGQQRLFLSVLRSKFPVLPHAVVTRVETADLDTLLRWSARLVTADTLDAVFADGPRPERSSP
jgi:hypothetical protein